jgi:hypothetical protein
MRALIMTKADPTAWCYMPTFRGRVESFDRRHCVDGNATNIASLFEECFATGDKRMLGILLMDDDGRPTGHIVAGVDLHHGIKIAVIYQFEKDVPDEVALDNNSQLQSVIDLWAANLGFTEVSALATSSSRARLFGFQGYRYASTVVTRRIGDGWQGKSDVEHDTDDPGVVAERSPAASDRLSP